MHRNVGLASLALAILAGCASSTEVRGADETESGSSSEAETTTKAAATAACAAGDSRSCLLRYTDAHGTAHCLDATQFCDEDGSAWLPCGADPAAR